MKKQLKIDLEDTIAAVSTPIGEGAIGIVRLSGKEALSIADKIFKSKKGVLPSKLSSFTIHYGYIYDAGGIADEVLLTVMRAPKSYTRQDMVEINCHSGLVTLRKILELVLNNGARLAEPGEFTKRAFLNGRINLIQAEAVLDIVKSKTEASLKTALGRLNGKLSGFIYGAKEELLSILAAVEASIDFPEEDLEIVSEADAADRLRVIKDRLSKLLDTADEGAILREGIFCVICGRPNVGKSSLLNALLRQDRAIVTPIPGTTRDTIEESANINGIPFKLVDTAGIISTEDTVEREGILRSRDCIERADLILLTLDGSVAMTEEDKTLLADTEDKPRIITVNKSDLPQNMDLNSISVYRPLKISAKEAVGLDELKSRMYDMVWKGKINAAEGAVIANLRQKESLGRAFEAVCRAIDLTEDNFLPELAAVELKSALDSLGEMTGEVIDEDVLDRIFSQFCVGK
ncbi:MAG: tRNA uridine-5-carboxymethylaminomethyl(34) synthesis GTPase MnmE [Candidatus Omnitrophota bacterium]